MLTSISIAFGWWSPRMPVKFYRPVKGWGDGGNGGGAKRRFNVKEQLSDARVSCCTDRYQQMLLLLSIVGESEDKGCRRKRDQDSGLCPKELEGVEDTLSLPETREKQEDGTSSHVEVKEKELKLKSKSQGVPTRVDFKYVFALPCSTRHYS